MNVVIADLIPFISLGNDQWGRCVFLGTNDKDETYCRIYDARPAKCRLYPAQIQGLTGKLAIDPKCPGIHVGEEQVIVYEKELKEFMEELKEHYTILFELVINNGYSPLEALFKAVEEKYKYMKEF